MDDYVEQRLSERIEQRGLDMTPEEAHPAFEEKLEIVEEKGMEDFDHQQKVDFAVGMLESDDMRSDRLGGSGEEMDLKILAVGHRGPWENHPGTEKDTVTAHAVIHGPIGSNGEVKAGVAVILLTADHVDLLEAQQKFHELNELTGTFEVEEAWNVDGFYRAYSTPNTDLVETDLDDLPSGRDEKNDLLRRMFPDTDLADLAEKNDGMSSFDPDSGYTNDWGVDVQRFSGKIVDYYINDEHTWGVYTLMDESVTPEDVEDTDLMGENQTIPGLSVHCVPDYHMNYGVNSVVDVYGVTEVDDNGQIIMRAAGIVPVIPIEMDDGAAADEGVDAAEEKI